MFRSFVLILSFLLFGDLFVASTAQTAPFSPYEPVVISGSSANKIIIDVNDNGIPDDTGHYFYFEYDPATKKVYMVGSDGAGASIFPYDNNGFPEAFIYTITNNGSTAVVQESSADAYYISWNVHGSGEQLLNATLSKSGGSKTFNTAVSNYSDNTATTNLGDFSLQLVDNNHDGVYDKAEGRIGIRGAGIGIVGDKTLQYYPSINDRQYLYISGCLTVHKEGFVYSGPHGVFFPLQDDVFSLTYGSTSILELGVTSAAGSSGGGFWLRMMPAILTGGE